jgi:FkbM family methyltransferase
MKQLRKLAKHALGRFGLGKIHHPSFARFMAHRGIQNVVDVGANTGHFATDLREMGYRGRIVSLEPNPEVFQILEQRTRRDPLWDAYCLGAGDVAGEMPISVTESSVFSSFKRPSAYSAGKFVGVREVRREMVPVVRLDEFLAERPEYLSRTYLKIDTQGFEEEVLIGAGSCLDAIDAIQVELALRPLYEGQETLVPMTQWMADRDFHIVMAKENGFDWQEFSLLELDVVIAKIGVP